MPRCVHMTWVGSQKRWTKMHKGTRYYVSTRELGTGPTMADSLLAANQWWEARRAQIDGRRPQPVMQIKYTDEPRSPDWCAGMESGAGWVLNAVAEQLPEPPPADHIRSVGAVARAWVDGQRQRQAAGRVGADRMDHNRRCLGHFTDWLGHDSPVDVIDGPRWAAWYGYLTEQVAGGRWQASFADRILQVSRRWVTYTWEMGLLADLPRNLHSREMSFRVTATAVVVLEDAEVRALLAAVPERVQSRLHVALMLNCGFTAADIDDLRPAEVDWDDGTITRKRSKTADHDDVPVVRYRLWPETLALLKRWRSQDPDRVLLTATGGRWIVEHQGDVSYSRSDCVASAMRVWLRKAGVAKPPKCLRATAASKLGEHPIYMSFVSYFLGHSPRTVADRHYRRPADELFFEALAWLRTALGVG